MAFDNPESVSEERGCYTVRGYSIPDMWGPTEVAAHLGVRQSNLASQVGLPAPIPRPPAPRIGGRLWIADEIREYARERGAQPKEPNWEYK